MIWELLVVISSIVPINSLLRQSRTEVLVLGDTNSCLSVIGAKRLHIPIFHMEAGNRCKDECLPEETNRRIVDIISDVNMAYSEHAEDILPIVVYLRNVPMSRDHLWRKYSITILQK